MMDYRAYTIGEDGHIVGSEAFEAVDDIAAIAHAVRFVESRDVEVWQGGRKVGVLKGDASA
jgi:hypothetical protein